MRSDMLSIASEILLNISSVRQCFGRRAYRKVDRFARFVLRIANVIETNFSQPFLNASDLTSLRSEGVFFHDVARKLSRRFKRGMRRVVRLFNFFLKRMSRIVEFQHSDLYNVSNVNVFEEYISRVVDKYVTEYPSCEASLFAVIKWYPQYWFPGESEKWSIFHRFYYYVSGVWYINAAVEFDVWWFWLVNPAGWPTYGLGLQ